MSTLHCNAPASASCRSEVRRSRTTDRLRSHELHEGVLRSLGETPAAVRDTSPEDTREPTFFLRDTPARSENHRDVGGHHARRESLRAGAAMTTRKWGGKGARPPPRPRPLPKPRQMSVTSHIPSPPPPLNHVVHAASLLPPPHQTHLLTLICRFQRFLPTTTSFDP